MIHSNRATTSIVADSCTRKKRYIRVVRLLPYQVAQELDRYVSLLGSALRILFLGESLDWQAKVFDSTKQHHESTMWSDFKTSGTLPSVCLYVHINNLSDNPHSRSKLCVAPRRHRFMCLHVHGSKRRGVLAVDYLAVGANLHSSERGYGPSLKFRISDCKLLFIIGVHSRKRLCPYT